MASAVNADHADTADTATNALKLGGYDASDYLRKDEVQTVTAAYQEIEWTSPGTYNWVVPEGVNAILVTTVGGGGGYGMLEYNASNQRYLIFPGGCGGEVIVNKKVSTTPGETLTIVAGTRGTYVEAPDDGYYRGGWNETDSKKYSGTNGGDGGISYVARKGTMISETKARGGAGGYAKWASSTGGKNGCLYNSATGKYDDCYYWYRTALVRNTNTITTKYSGASTYYIVPIAKGPNAKGTPSTAESTLTASKGYLGEGGMGDVYNWSGGWNNMNYYRSAAIYINGGGGGSYGNGAGYDSYANIGGGGYHYRYHGVRDAAPGMVRILAIGVTYDE